MPRHSLSSYGRRAFAVAGQTAWNSQSDDLRDPTLNADCFRRLPLKLGCFQTTSTHGALDGIACINSQLTYFSDESTMCEKLEGIGDMG